MNVAIKTLQAFSGPDGRHAKDVVIKVPSERATWLVDNGFAVRVDVPVQKAASRPADKAAPKIATAKVARKAK